jgi:hypothetical protein
MPSIGAKRRDFLGNTSKFFIAHANIKTNIGWEMEVIKIITEFFLVSMVFSYTLFSPIASSKLTGNGFIKLISNLSIGLLALAIIVNAHSGLVYKIISAIAIVFISFFHRDDKNWVMWGLYGLVVVLLGIHLNSFSNHNTLNAFFLFSSTIFLGIITYAMTLGHWYLVVPKLSEKPLKIAAIITWIILVLKLIIMTFSIINHLEFFTNTDAFQSTIVIMRILFGYVVILIMSIFNWKLVSLRSIQSSTGILYAMTFFVFIGELISGYLYFNFGLLI